MSCANEGLEKGTAWSSIEDAQTATRKEMQRADMGRPSLPKSKLEDVQQDIV